MPDVTYVAAGDLAQGQVITPNENGDLRAAVPGDPGPFFEAVKATPAGSMVMLTTWCDSDPVGGPP